MSYIDEQLARRLTGESSFSEVAHVILVIVAGALAWPSAPDGEIIGWVIVVSAAAIARGALRRRAAGRVEDTAFVHRCIRTGVVLLGVAWGAGAIVIGTQMPLDTLAFVTIIFAGLVSGALASMLADRVAFYTFIGLLLAPIAIAIEVVGDARMASFGVFVIGLYALAMIAFYRRAHTALVEQFQMAKDLESSVVAARSARDAEQYLVRIIEATTDHVGIAAIGGNIRYMNRAGRAMLGVGPDEPLDGINMKDVIAPSERERAFNEHIPIVLRDGFWQGEVKFQHRDGHEIPVSLVALAHRDANGNVESLSAVARDMTHELAVRSALRSARDAAEQATAAKSAFLANTSHEIRTPLNGILGMVELLLDTELTVSQRRSAELIGESGEALLATINDLLDLSKIEAGQLDLEAISFDLHHVIHSSVRLQMHRAHAKGVELISDVDADVPQYIVGDPHRIRQVLANLVSNAVKFTGAGDVVVSARLLQRDGNRFKVRIGVKDSGIGIADEDRERIFEPFRQVDVSTTRQYGGTGLGLSIARKLIEMMGGRLDLVSTPGVGSDFHFTIWFPEGAATAKATGAPDTSLNTVRALVVDDHPTNRRVTVEMLEWGGAAADDAPNAAAALDQLRKAAAAGTPYNLIVSDVHMPVQDGFTFAEMVRADPALRQTRIMFLTSAGEKGDGQRCRDLGVSAYMHKPVSRVELIEATIAAFESTPDNAETERASLVTRHSIDEARRQLRILLAEDNRVNQVVASSLLRKRGHLVDIANNGREAVDAIERDPAYDVVLMDMQMPELDGIAATREIRDRGHALRIVALTANVSAGERERCLGAGMTGYLSKPFKAHELFAVVEGWIAADGDGDGARATPIRGAPTIT